MPELRSQAQHVWGHVPEEFRRPIMALGLGVTLLAMLIVIDTAGSAIARSNSETRLDVATVTADAEKGAEKAAPAGEKTGETKAAQAGDATSSEAAAAKPATPEAEPESEAKPETEKRSSEMVGFYVNWDEKSHASLAKNIDEMTIVMPEWYHVGPDGRLDQANAKKQARAMKLIKEKNPDLRVMPIVNNFGPAASPDDVARMLKKSGMRKRIAEDIVRTMKAGGFDGVNVDFEGLTKESRVDLVRFMRELYPLAKKNGLEVSQDVLASSETYDYTALAANADYLIPMMYDEHWKGGGSGPVSSQGWYQTSLRKFFEKVPPEKVVIALGTYGYDWASGGSKGKAVTYPEARALAKKHGQPIKLHGDALNSTFAYREGGKHHRVWMLDAASAFNQVKAASKHEPRGYAIWRLGGEDPGLWEVLSNRDDLDSGVADNLRSWNRFIQYDKDKGLITGQRIAPN